MAYYRKKPVVIEAFELTQDFLFSEDSDHPDWAQDAVDEVPTGQPGSIECHDDHITIATLEGTMRGDMGDFIIRGVKGEIYPCKPDIFAATYEPATQPGEV